jgi:type VI secretion system protein ImpA
VSATETGLVERLLAATSAEGDAGPNLEYEPSFQLLEELARVQPERVMGAGVIGKEEPDWPSVELHARALLEQSKDLRIAIHLCGAWVHIDGLPGWFRGLHLIRQLLERYWDSLHPRLEHDLDNIATERANSLAPLNDPAMLLRSVRMARLFDGLHPGSFCLRDVRILTGTLKPGARDDMPMPDRGAIDACLHTCPLEALLELELGISQALDDLGAIVGRFDMAAPGFSPKFDTLAGELTELRTFIAPYLAERVPASPLEVASAGDASAPAAERATTGAAVERREDVLRVLAEVCDYYARHEPSSPIPALVKRVMRLVNLPFAELLRDLAPSGLSEFQHLSGASQED